MESTNSKPNAVQENTDSAPKKSTPALEKKVDQLTIAVNKLSKDKKTEELHKRFDRATMNAAGVGLMSAVCIGCYVFGAIPNMPNISTLFSGLKDL